ncbi:MAG: putative lipopolysaccharide heptosyltransferase III [Betaproteobacteria bacterium]|nr:MAG: putative lipopolysaccharide heptosyltransferase III [Betaproteobacteria bacterium]
MSAARWSLKRAIPAAEIDALVYRETAPMLEGHPAICEIHCIDREWKRQGLIRQASAERALLAALRARRYDLIVHLTEHPRGALLARMLRPRYAVGRHLEDAHRLWRTSFTHHYRLPRTTPRHTVECNLDALRRIGLQPFPQEKRLVLRPSASDAARVSALLAEHSLKPRAFIQVHPGSRWLFKCASPPQYAALLDRIVAAGTQVVLTAAPDARERALVDAILSASAQLTRRSLVDLCGVLTLRELAALTGQAQAFVGVDSAPMHIAAAMGTPVVAMFGPSGEVEWRPWGVEHRVVASLVHPCRPCGNDGCGGGKVSECLTELPVDRVYAALVDLLAETAGRR